MREKQTEAFSQILSLFKDYKVVVLGDREFCSVKLGNWLREQQVYFCLRLKKNEFIRLEDEIYLQLSVLGLSPGMTFFLNGVSVTKQQGFAKFNVACKWKRKYWGWAPDEGWFILTNLPNLEPAILAYKKRFGIEEMFRDFKKGGYNLEETKVPGERLVVLILLIAIAYTNATIQGIKMKRIGIQNYIGRVQEVGRIERRHSSFYIGLYGQIWANFIEQCADAVSELIGLTRNKWKFYRKGLRAMKLILSTLQHLLSPR